MTSNNRVKIFWVKFIHTIVYIVMVASVFETLYASITKNYSVLLYVALFMLAMECIVYFGNGRVCPFTSLAKKYGDPKGYAGDIFIPQKMADNTFYIFGALFIIAIIILIMNILGLR